MVVTLEKIVSLAKRRGFIFPGSELYGGLANSWDYGPLGVELKRNIMDAWWKRFVMSRADMVGLDAAVIMNPKVWEASGHLAEFTDPMVECKKCHNRFRAEPIVTYRKDENSIDKMKKIMELGIETDNDKIFDENKAEIYWECENCQNKNFSTEVRQFNLMFKTFLGVTEDSKDIAYLRGELAQAMFADFKLVQESMRTRLPFGIASQGKCFRNEITPGNFIYRTREFNLMEFEYFMHPKEWKKYFEYWLGEMKAWLDFCGVRRDHLVFREIPAGERAHYSKRTVDIEYQYPFGQKELYGIAYRGDFDIANHIKKSGVDLTYTDPETGEKFVPHVVEPTFGIDRTMLVTLLEAYEEVEPRSGSEETKEKHEKEVVLRLPKALAPVKVAVLPLSKKESLSKVAEEIAVTLRKQWVVQCDETGSIGKRYRRQDEIGTPYCVTVDFDSLDDKKVTVRDRDTMAQDRVTIEELADYLQEKFRYSPLG